MTSKIELGDKVKDVVTGFSGIVTAITEYLTGCAQVSVNPGCDKDGDPRESFGFDETRLKITKKKAIVIDEEKDPEKKPAKKGADFNAMKLRKNI